MIALREALPPILVATCPFQNSGTHLKRKVYFINKNVNSEKEASCSVNMNFFEGVTHSDTKEVVPRAPLLHLPTGENGALKLHPERRKQAGMNEKKILWRR